MDEATDEQGGPTPNGLSEAEKRRNVIHFVFGDDEDRFESFRRTIVEAVPEVSRVVIRGSAVTGQRWNDGAPFDGDGPGTSDVDLTLVGAEVVQLFKLSGFFVPGVHSRPLSDDDPDIAPKLVTLRRDLMNLAGRPVNIQATLDFVMYLRGDLLGQPYLTLIDERNES